MATTKKRPGAPPEFAEVFLALRRILVPYAPKLRTVHDTPTNYHLDTYTIGPGGRPIMFAGVRINRKYVSYYFMPIYGAEQRGISPALRKRMQGKACFNLTAPDRALLAELKTLTKQGWSDWKKLEWV
jgi:hypothetical protein